MKTMKSMILGVLAVTAAWSVRGVERIAVDEVVTHYPWDGKVDCVTSLSGLEDDCFYKGAFTLSVKKEGEAVRRTVTNDFPAVGSVYAAAGVFTNTFDCAALFGEGVYPNGGIAVDLIRTEDRTGEPIGITGDVLVINISAGNKAATYPTKEYSGVDLGTFNCDIYKTDKIVLLKVPAGTYYCEPGSSGTVSQQLTTKGFYIGVFKVTRRQFELVMRNEPLSPSSTDAQCPAADSWYELRSYEEDPGSAIPSSLFDNDEFLKRLEKKTGLAGFDLPTEAQWEMAARAGATAAYGAYWDGSKSVDLTASNLGEVAWYKDNSGSGTHAVGGKRPNLWGLYDTLGIAYEWCRDKFISTYNTSCVDTPCTQNEDQGIFRVARGGRYDDKAADCRPSIRWASHYLCNEGFRISKPLH